MRRVRRPKDKEELFDLLTEDIFETYKDVMLFASALGASRDESKSFRKKSESIDYGIFSSKTDNEALILMTGIYKTDGVDILSPEESKQEQLLTIFEEYANAGLEIIQQKIDSMGSNPLEAILNLVTEAETMVANEVRDFESLINNIKSP